ncbi:ATP-binding protein [Natronoglycomyces albus]|uniref:ATP-binding protein n=1 Tax=Natronoglycomyces albus TaxID=2811108 RepID=A0A895XJX9_9ACTN|nr:ATP-binding protein [Natronoglycomyces albus]QSB05327.1 ATP-binding protein [Natronoglycomyces albus]
MPHHATATAMTRSWIRQHLPAVTSDALDDLQAVATELVSNAIRHAQALPGNKLWIQCRADEDHVEFSVVDGGSGSTPVVRPVNLESADGRGLFIVAHLADEWGARCQAGGRKEVWARVKL